jgi:hypothetical protein
MSSGTTTTTGGTSNQVNQIPSWVNTAGEQNYAYAQNVASQPLQQYQGQMVADVAPQSQQAWNTAANSANVGQQQYQEGETGFMNTLGSTPQQVSPQSLASTNLQPYMNPYTQSVINTTLPIMQQQLGLSQNQQQNNANSANAFGGSRQAIQQGVTQAQGAQNMAQMAEQLNQANFGQAQAAATGDISRNLTAQQANQGAGLTQEQLANAAAQGLGALGAQQQSGAAADFTMQQAAGAAQQAQAQDQINAQMAKFQQAFNYPQQGLGMLESALSMTPYNTATSGAQTGTATTPTNWGALALGGLTSLGSFFKPSDRKLKKDIVHLGKDPITRVPIKSFRFKGQHPLMPKIIGPLAQDIEKRAPGSTVKIGGIMHVPRETLARATPSVAHLPTHASRMPQPVWTPPFQSTPGEGRLWTPPSSPGVARAIGTMPVLQPKIRGALG